MNIKFPIGIQNFEKIIEGGYTYIDKTDLIYSLAKGGNTYFLSRPRRFGKSLLLSTLECYFQGRKDLFKGLKIEALEKDWETYPVFHIDFGTGNFTSTGTLTEALDDKLKEWESKCNQKNNLSDLSLRFYRVIEQMHKQTGKRVVVLIDEYDKPLLDVMGLPYTIDFQGQKISLEEYNRNTLKAFYSTFKAADEHLQFVFLTGVTKFSQVSVFSGFNQPKDISMHSQYDTLCGITEEEMTAYFKEQIEQMAKIYECSFSEMVEMLKKQYDGYHFSDTLKGIFNPFSLLNAFDRMRLDDYWFQTGTPTYLIRLLQHYDENLNELTGKYYTAKDFVDYKADTERPLPMIYQSGYLTITGYDRRTRSFKLDIPNDEVKQGFIALIANNYLNPKQNVDSWIISAVRLFDSGDTEQLHEAFTAFFASIPYSMRRKENEREKERYFHYTFYLILRLMSTYVVYTEKQQSHGRVDCIIETDKFVYVFEFKLDGTAAEAMQQIEEKGYAEPYRSGTRTVYKIGCVFSSETGTISDWLCKKA